VHKEGEGGGDSIFAAMKRKEQTPHLFYRHEKKRERRILSYFGIDEGKKKRKNNTSSLSGPQKRDRVYWRGKKPHLTFDDARKKRKRKARGLPEGKKEKKKRELHVLL